MEGIGKYIVRGRVLKDNRYFPPTYFVDLGKMDLGKMDFVAHSCSSLMALQQGCFLCSC